MKVGQAGRQSHNSEDHKLILKDIIKVVFPVGVSVWMILWFFGKIDVAKMDRIISGECNFWWIGLMMVISVMSHIIRGVRWGIQLRGAGLPRVSVMTESLSIFGAYALNLIFPLLGETWRCVFMAREEKSKMSTVVGTDLGDRFSDAVVIIVLCILAMIVARDSMIRFKDHYRFGERLLAFMADPWIWGSVFGLVIVLGLMFYLCRQRTYVVRLVDVIRELWRSFAVMFRMKGRGMYLVLTLGIWICYYLEIYVCFFAFPFTRELISDPSTFYGLIPCLVTFVFGSASIAIPSTGGLGPWNIAVAYSLMLYGIGETDGAAYAMVVWGFRSAMLVVLGLFTAGWIFLHRQNNR